MSDAKPEPKQERYQTLDEASSAELGALLRDHRQAALGSLAEDGAPAVTMVAYALDEAEAAFLLHLSELAPHKARLRRDPRCSLMILQPDDGRREILAHQRASFACRAEIVARDAPDHAATKAAYLAALPKHEMMFSLGDFDLVRLRPAGGLWNAGFGRAYPLDAASLRSVLGG